MSKQLETKKIRVSNGQELITEVKKYKNLGVEWKFREKYWSVPTYNSLKNGNENAKSGIIISNGEQEIEIYSENVTTNYDGSNRGKNAEDDFLVNRLDEVRVREQLHQIFPEAKKVLFQKNIEAKDSTTFQVVKGGNEEYELWRYLVAENSWHLKKILNQYVRDNEAKIYQSDNPHFSWWVDIIDGQDGNIYLYVGEKKDGDGREIKIGIQKSEFENCKRDEDDSPKKALEDFWGLFTINRPRTPTEEREYYSNKGGLEKEFQRNWKHRKKLCRSYLESLQSRMTEKLNYWKKEPESKEKDSGIVKSHARIDEIYHELEDMKTNRPIYYSACDNDCNICGVKLCCHYEGRTCKKDKKWLFFSPENEELNHCSLHWKSDSKSSTSSKSNTEKNQLLQYFLENDIESIELDGEILIIEYKNQEKKTWEINNQELKQIQKSLQNQPNQYLSLAQLQANNNHSNLNPDNHKLTIGLIVGGVILVGIIVIYLFAHKKKKNR